MPGVGPTDEARLLDALAREDAPRPRGACCLNVRASSSMPSRARSDGEAAGDVRRWRDACERLAVVVLRADPAPALARFESLPQIVAVIERGERRAVG